MNIELSDEQFRKLLEHASLGHYVVTGNKDGRGEEMEEDDALHKYLLNIGEQEGFYDCVERFHDTLVPTDDFSQRMEQEIDEFEEDSFWTILARWLGLRDIHQDYSEEQLTTMGERERLELVDRYISRYEKEFEEHGMEHLKVLLHENEERG